MTPEGDFELAYLAADGTVRRTGGLPEPANVPETPAPVNPDQPQRPPRIPKDPPPRTTESAAVLALDGATVIDLYAGSGALGLESASRALNQTCVLAHDAEGAQREWFEIGIGLQ